MILVLISVALLSYVGWTLICLEANYRRASRMGIPLIRIPIDFHNIPFQVFEPLIWLVFDFFRIPLPRAARYMRRGWAFDDKAQSHLEMGPAFAFVTPREILVQLCDPEAVHDVWSRRVDFPRPAKIYRKYYVRYRH